MDKQVSAVITTHNRLELLKRAINSVLNQTYANMECIVVSDNSTDGTDDYCANIKQIRFISISASQSKGGNYARNIGISAAKGEYVAFLDDDDYWLPEKIEQQLSLAEEKHSGFVYCRRYFERLGRGSASWIEEEQDECPTGDLSERIFKHYISSTSCFFVKRSLMLDVGCFDERVAMWQDYDLFIRLAQKTQIFVNDAPLCVYTLDEQDSKKISNKFSRCPHNMVYLMRKYSPLLKKFSWRTRLCFYDAMITEIQFRADKYNVLTYKWLLKPWVWLAWRMKKVKK